MFGRKDVPCRNSSVCGVIVHRKGSAEEIVCEARIQGKAYRLPQAKKQ